MKQRETLIRKIIPVELFDMAGLEHWLSDMAAQGLHLVKLNHDTARFRRGEPVSGVRFGLEITGVADIDRERNAAYQEAGWTYVTTLPEPVLCLPDGAGGSPAPPHRPGDPERDSHPPDPPHPAQPSLPDIVASLLLPTHAGQAHHPTLDAGAVRGVGNRAFSYTSGPGTLLDHPLSVTQSTYFEAF